MKIKYGVSGGVGVSVPGSYKLCSREKSPSISASADFLSLLTCVYVRARCVSVRECGTCAVYCYATCRRKRKLRLHVASTEASERECVRMCVCAVGMREAYGCSVCTVRFYFEIKMHTNT